MKTPTKTPSSGRKPPSGRTSSTTKAPQPQIPLTVTTADTVASEDIEPNEDNVNELLPCVLELDDDEHCFATRFPAVYGHTKKNCKFVFRMDDNGSWFLDVNVMVPKEL
jgi:hypothetical protein